MYQTQLKYMQKSTPSFTGKTCSPLLCYRKANRTNSYGNAIAKPPALLHSPLLYYTTLATQISSGNAIAKTT